MGLGKMELRTIGLGKTGSGKIRSRKMGLRKIGLRKIEEHINIQLWKPGIFGLPLV